MIEMTKEIYKVSELAEMFNVSARTIYNWVKENRIRNIRLGPKSMRIAKSEIMRLLDQGDTVDE